MGNQTIKSPWYNRLWRIIGTGIGFLFFGLGGLFLSLVVFPLYNLLIWHRERRRLLAQSTIKLSFRLFLSFIAILRVLKFRYIGLEKLEQGRGVIVIANHPSILDYVVLASKMPHCDCVVKEALMRNIFVRGAIKAADYIQNDEIDLFIPECQQRLEKGGMLLIFPEGTRTTAYQPIKLQRGAANIALRTGFDLRLVTIHLTHPMLTKELKWYTIPCKMPILTVKVEERIDIAHYLAKEQSLNVMARDLTDVLTQKINDNLNYFEESGHDIT